MATNTVLNERRLVHRILSYWRDLAPDGKLPSVSSVQAAGLSKLWPACFILDVGGLTPVFSYLGEVHIAHHGSDLTGRSIEEAGADTLLGCSVEYLDEILSVKIPITYGGTFTGGDGQPVPYRSIMLPLSDDGETINAILGGANCGLPVFK